MSETRFISALTIDEKSLPPSGPDMMHERRVAIFDLLEGNEFYCAAAGEGPYSLHVRLQDDRLVLDLSSDANAQLHSLTLGLTPFRRIIKDYFMVCESYHEAIRTGTSARIEAIDMGRRGLHNEGSRLLSDTLSPAAVIDFNTARRIFTVICSLNRRQTR